MRSYALQSQVGELEPAAVARARTGSARIVAALTAANGILNLVSVMGGAAPATHPAWLRALLPVDFAGLSRTATLLLGFCLILAAIHLWAGRKRAWRLAMWLASASVLFHLTKAWDIEEAVGSALVAWLLWLSRRDFRFGAERPGILRAAARAAIALSVAGLYGAAGFWLLEPREFHHNFHWWEAAANTIRLMLFAADPPYLPHTSYAVWFLDSLVWLSAFTFLYCGFALFRPVAYRFRSDSTDCGVARKIAETYGSSAQDFFKHAPDKSCFFSSTHRSFIGYRVAAHYALALGDPVGPEEERGMIVDEFLSYCERHGWRAGFHQAGPESLALYESRGFRKLKIGDDAIVDLRKFSLTGSRMKEFRNTVTRLDRLGYSVRRIEAPVPDHELRKLASISESWLSLPGHRERQFTLGRFDTAYVESTTVYAVADASGDYVAFLNLVPSYREGLATVDLMRRTPDSVNGVMDYLFARTFLDLKERGINRFSLGMAPLEAPGSERTADERILHWLMRRAPFLFRTDSLRRFKAKYADEWSPRYTVYRERSDLPRLALALRRVSELPRRALRRAA